MHLHQKIINHVSYSNSILIDTFLSLKNIKFLMQFKEEGNIADAIKKGFLALDEDMLEGFYNKFLLYYISKNNLF